MAETQNQTNTSPRPPIVVVLGHVDHGKTSLLDAIRQTDVASREHGGITQGIGAYQITTPDTITFIDTPGHEAFSQMRSQGTKVADIAVLVVAGNDSVMPQTVEAIKIIKDAKIPYIVAINKIDLPEANADKVIQDLLRHEVLVENYGGDVPFVKLSAKQGTGIKELLEMIDLIAKMNNVSGDPTAPVVGSIIESRLDKGRGPVATAVIRNGTLHQGDSIKIAGNDVKIRALIDYKGGQLKEAGPGTPVEILGLNSVPPVGTALNAEAETATASTEASTTVNENSIKVILRADTVGSLDAIKAKIPEGINVLSSEVGEISEADVLLAKSTGALVLGFNVKAGNAVSKLAESEKVLVRTYKIIYELLDEMEDAAQGALEDPNAETILGVGQIVAEFPFDKTKIAGTKVTDGRIARGDMVRIMRVDTSKEDGELTVGTARVKSVRTGKEEVTKVEKGKECGLLFDTEVDFKPGDAIISYSK